ncbi:hypothetical protein MKW98_003615 [Papaver atlanticum]|uniref:Disease resistance protein n=1 Tax=Papaver atlanticum TaxID=357466 RepID=A0AAD4SIX4_9MAGN|nr:hypothetical protein MKW98_003615 [Papaver atlanticum]
MADIVIGPLVEIAAENGIQAFKRQVSYCINYKKSAGNLARKVKDLNDMRTDIQNRVVAAKKNLDSVKSVVVTWLERVNKEADQDEMVLGLMRFVRGEDAEIFNHGGCCSWCCLLNRRKISKESQKKFVVIDGLLKQGREFGEISELYSYAVTEIITKSTKSEDSVTFASQELVRKQVLRALKDERTFSVGIYGMEGVGKTTLKNQIHRQVIEEKLFNVVITIVVSQNVNLRNIQNHIAEALEFPRLKMVNDEISRAALLKERLRQEKKVLVIFDDLWTRDLDLSDVGIPYCHKDCKVLITTRFLEVCNSLKIEQNIKLEVLSDEDSWYLFKTNVGDAMDSPALQMVARDVVKECGCLPLALVTVGKALRNKDKFEWDYTANQLKSSNLTDIEGMTSNVYTSIKLSYDFLGNDILKRCFLLCCLFPEDYLISVDDLVIYAFGDDVICRDLEKWAEVWVRLHKALVKLVALGLLIGYQDKFAHRRPSAKMHDFVRDVAISIASKDGNPFYIKTGLSLQKWPEAGISSTSKCSRLSLFDNNITLLPDQPDLPHLLNLSLRGNKSLEKIPDRFFQNLGTLLSLDVGRTGISSLPLSLSSLVNLRSLDMSSCNLHSQLDISGLGKLKKLEILDLAGMDLTITLPEEIGDLSCLKWLDLSYNFELIVPPGVMSRLTCLEYLNMAGSFEQWEVGAIIDERCIFANLDEIASLTCLNCVELTAKWDAGSLSINGRTAITPLDSRLTGSSPFPNSIKVLMTKVETVRLDVCSGLKSVGALVPSSRGFNNLKTLKVSECNEMECVLSMVKEEIPKAAFRALEVLTLESLGNLKEVFHGPMPAEFSMENIRRVKLMSCTELVYIFSHEVLLKLENMEELMVRGFLRLKEVFVSQERTKVPNEKEEHGLILLPQFRQLILVELVIRTIWKGIFSPIHCFGNLKDVEVHNCSRLRHLFTPAIVIALQQLESLYVCACRSLVTIIASEDQLTSVVDNQVINNHFQSFFPNLRILYIQYCKMFKVFFLPLAAAEEEEEEDDDDDDYLVDYADRDDYDDDGEHCPSRNDMTELNLDHLPHIKNIWDGIRSLWNITSITVDTCERLKHLIPIQVLVSGGLSQLKFLMVHDCKSLEAIFDIDDVIVADELQNHIILENLKTLIVRDCKSLKYLLPKSLLGQAGLPKLEILEVDDCPEIEVILYEDGKDNFHGGNTVTSPVVEVLAKLRRLYLFHLPSLSSFHQQGNTSLIFGWPSLLTMCVANCNLKRLPFGNKNVPPKLEKIRVDSVELFEKWLKFEDERTKSSLRSLFKLYDGKERPEY